MTIELYRYHGVDIGMALLGEQKGLQALIFHQDLVKAIVTSTEPTFHIKES